MAKLTNHLQWTRFITSSTVTIHLTLKMTSAQAVETSVSPRRSHNTNYRMFYLLLLFLFFIAKVTCGYSRLKLIKCRSKTRTAKSAGKVTSENYHWSPVNCLSLFLPDDWLMRALCAVGKPDEENFS